MPTPSLPSSTVENYLKAILQAQQRLDGETALVPMGRLAQTLGVTPGTATTMVKALADAQLVDYAPYAGVRLTLSGEKLATLVLRRHRIVELFLVDVLGLSWTEVHDEAERLEHAVSDRVIEAMDVMLGHPNVDPHGDPIPAHGARLLEPEHRTLVTCGLGTPLRVTRILDQDAEFLAFVERHHLRPGAKVRCEARDDVADRVRVRVEGKRPITIGWRAASRVAVD